MGHTVPTKSTTSHLRPLWVSLVHPGGGVSAERITADVLETSDLTGGPICLTISSVMRPRTVTFRPGQDLLDAMAALRHRDGIPPSEQLRRALMEWLPTKGIVIKADRTRAATRKRS